MVGRTRVILAVGLALTLALALGGPMSSGVAQPWQAGLSVTDLEGQRLDWTSLLEPERHRLLVFATTWCSVCRREVSAVEDWAEREADRIDVTYIFSGSDVESVAETVERYGPRRDHLSIVVDADGALAEAYGVTATPTFVLADGPVDPVGTYSHLSEVPLPWVRYSDSGEELGTRYDVVVLAPREARWQVEADLHEVRQLCHHLGERFSEWRDDSELMQLNHRAPTEAVEVSSDLRRMLDGALELAEVTGGAFDPTWKPLQALWDEAERTGTPPSAERLAATLGSIGAGHVVVEGSRVRFDDPGTLIGLEGVAKGWIVDAVFHALIARGYESVLVNIGGDLRTTGRDADGARRLLRIVDPFDRQSTAGVLEVEDIAVATSGNYLRFRQVGSERVGHILDPRTGRPPAFNGSVTVLAPDAAMADALATALFVLGPEAGMRLAGELDHVGVVYVTESGIVSNVSVGSE